MIGTNNCDSDWGRVILEDFVACGGFANPESLADAHTKLTELIASDYDPDDSWHFRCNALAIFVLIHLELGISIEPDDLISISIASALERLPNRENPYWFGQLTFDLALWACGTNTIYLGNVSDSLFQTVKQTTKAIWDDDFPNRGHANYNVLGCLFGKDVILDLRQLIHTKDLLERLGNAGADEAFFFLSLGFGDGPQCEKWLRRAVTGSWPTSQVATFHFACILRSSNRRDWQQQIKSVKFALDDDPEYEYLCHVALKARSLTPDYRGGKNLVSGSEDQGKYLDDWSVKSVDVIEQWDAVRRCHTRVYDLIVVAQPGKPLPADTPESVRSLALETGRLVEAFLKWCLSVWFPGPRHLDETESITNQGLIHFTKYVGQILGSGSSITLQELLHASGMTLDKHEVNFLIGGNRKSHGVWTSSTGIPSLVVANAMAARSHVNHPFRCMESENLIRAMSTFNAAYGIRNRSSAHYVRESDSWVSSSEVLFLSNSVLAFVDQLMSLSAKLIDRRIA